MALCLLVGFYGESCTAAARRIRHPGATCLLRVPPRSDSTAAGWKQEKHVNVRMCKQHKARHKARKAATYTEAANRNVCLSAQTDESDGRADAGVINQAFRSRLR